MDRASFPLCIAIRALWLGMWFRALMQMKGEAEAIYRAADSFYEAPHEVHVVAANASA